MVSSSSMMGLVRLVWLRCMRHLMVLAIDSNMESQSPKTFRRKLDGRPVDDGPPSNTGWEDRGNTL
jgi:hypothetical protein